MWVCQHAQQVGALHLHCGSVARHSQAGVVSGVAHCGGGAKPPLGQDMVSGKPTNNATQQSNINCKHSNKA